MTPGVGLAVYHSDEALNMAAATDISCPLLNVTSNGICPHPSVAVYHSGKGVQPYRLLPSITQKSEQGVQRLQTCGKTLGADLDLD